MPAKPARILDAAIAVIEDGGMQALTQPRVAARADMRQSHLTYYFPTRDDLVTAVAERIVTLRTAAVNTATAADDPFEALTDMLVDPRQTRLLTGLVEIADKNPAIAQSFSTLRSAMGEFGDRLLVLLGKASTPAARDLLQVTSTGIAVLALGNGGTAFRSTAIAALEALFDALPPEPTHIGGDRA